MAEWAAQSAAHAVSPDFPNEFGAAPAATRTFLSARRRVREECAAGKSGRETKQLHISF